MLSYLVGLGGQGLALMFGFGAAGLAGMMAEPRTRSAGVLFTGIVAPLVVLYMAYYFGGGGPMGAAGNLRFLVPTFPFFAIAGVWVLWQLALRLGRPGRCCVAAVAVLQVVVGAGMSHQMLVQAKGSLGAATSARRLAEAEVPPDAVLIVDRQLAESLDAVGTWKLVDESLVVGGFGGPGAFGGRGGPGPMMRGDGPNDRPTADRPSPQQVGKNQLQRERYAGLRPDERRERVWSDIIAWADARPVFWFSRAMATVDNALPEGGSHRRIAEVDAPMMLAPGAMMGGAGGGGPGGGRGPGTRPGGMRGGPGMGAPGMRGFGPRGGPAEDGGDGARGKLQLLRITVQPQA